MTMDCLGHARYFGTRSSPPSRLRRERYTPSQDDDHICRDEPSVCGTSLGWRGSQQLEVALDPGLVKQGLHLIGELGEHAPGR